MLRQVLLFCLLIAAIEATIVAHLSGALNAAREYGESTEITDFEADTEVEFTHQNGRLIVQHSTYYYIYAQVWIENYEGIHRNRVALTVNGEAVSVLQTSNDSDYGGLFTGVTKFLNRGDYISLEAVYPSKLWMSNGHTFFGAHSV